MAAFCWDLPDTCCLEAGLLVAHRMRTLEHCDIRLEMEHGRLESAVRITQQNASPSRLDSAGNTVTVPGGARRG